MSEIYTQLDSLLSALPLALIEAGLCADQQPEAAAFQSVEPFCIDTMSLPQWLQFVMLPRFEAMIKEKQPLPDRCAIAPVAEEYFKGQPRAQGVIALLVQIDALISE